MSEWGFFWAGGLYCMVIFNVRMKWKEDGIEGQKEIGGIVGRNIVESDQYRS